LEVQKKWKINENGIKIMVVRSNNTSYHIYCNGYHVTTDQTWQQAFELVEILLKNNDK
jgi:hypothetical protein